MENCGEYSGSRSLFVFHLHHRGVGRDLVVNVCGDFPDSRIHTVVRLSGEKERGGRGERGLNGPFFNISTVAKCMFCDTVIYWKSMPDNRMYYV